MFDYCSFHSASYQKWQFCFRKMKGLIFMKVVSKQNGTSYKNNIQLLDYFSQLKDRPPPPPPPQKKAVSKQNGTSYKKNKKIKLLDYFSQLKDSPPPPPPPKQKKKTTTQYANTPPLKKKKKKKKGRPMIYYNQKTITNIFKLYQSV